MKVRVSWVMRIVSGAGCLLLLLACDRKADDSAWWDGERERVELQSRLDLMKYRHSVADSASSGDLVVLNSEARRLARAKDRLNGERSALLTEIATLETSLAGAGGEQRKAARAAALGKRFERLSTADGRSFENASVVRIEDGGVSIRHDHGAATLKYGDLTPVQRTEFGIDEESSITAEKRSAEQQVEYDLWLSREMAAVEKKREESAARELASDQRDARIRAAALAKAEIDYQNRPLARAATPVGTGSIWRNSWYGDSYYYPYTYRRRSVYYYTPSFHVPPCRSSVTNIRPEADVALPARSRQTGKPASDTP